MPSRLIINADDFGLTKGINQSIASLHDAGVLTSATLMATGAAFEDAVQIAKLKPSLGVGCHIVLTDGVPVSDPARIPSLIGPDGRSFRSSLLSFVQALLRGQIRASDIECEVEAQIGRLQQAGIAVTHADTHKHTHLFPQVGRPLLNVLERAGIRAIRNPFEPAFSRQLAHAGFKRRTQIQILNQFRPAFERQQSIHAGNIVTTAGTLGVSATGNLNSATLSDIMRSLPPDGDFELVCHPGYNDADLARVPTRLRNHREVEMEALLTAVPAALAQPNPPQLIHYGNLTAIDHTLSS